MVGRIGFAAFQLLKASFSELTIFNFSREVVSRRGVEPLLPP